MPTYKTALVLVLGLTSVLAWELPAIPANRRAQYYVQHGDGGYKYGYDTGEGHSGLAVADAANQVQGEYSYVDEAGQRVNLKYTAGHEGFVPVTSGGSVGGMASGFGSRGHSGVIPSAATVDPHFDPNSDASYNFLIDTESYKRTEAADSEGNIQGQYSYTSPAGGSHAISYVAGEGTGFVVTSKTASGVPAASGYRYPTPPKPKATYVPPATSYTGQTYDGNTQVNSDGSFSFAYSTPAHGHQAAADPQGNVRGSYSFVAEDGVSRKVDYTAGANQGYVAKGAHLPATGAHTSAAGAHLQHSSDSVYQYAAPAHHGGIDADANSDGSYAYSYDAGTSVKQETADAQGNVKGSFSFVAGDGVPRKISYTARKNEGFVVSGDHLPAAPTASGQEVGLVSHNAFAHPDLFASSGNANAGDSGSVTASKPGAYSYSYTTGGKSAAAKSTSAGINTFGAAGKKSYNAPVSVSGSHGSSTGHVMAAKDGAYSYSYSTGGQSGVNSGAAFKSAQHGYGSGVGNSYSSPSVRSGSHGASVGHVMASKDGDYSYSYSTGGQTGVNSGAAFKSTQGQGSGISNHYSSPSVSSGAHDASSGHVVASKDGAYSYSYSTGGKSASPGHGTFGSGAVKPYSDSAAGTQQGDASYSFSYDAGTHNHQQSSDPNNNVHGSYSYKSKDDGQVRQVEYSAGSGTGFVARGAHIPGGSAGASVLAKQGNYPAAAPIYEDPEEDGDASYSYSYNTDTSSKQETADAQGNVVGTFSYVGADGVNRKLSYTARNEAGFNAAGAHLPVASSGGSGGNFAARTSLAQSRTSVHSRGSAGNTAVVSKYLPPTNTQKFGYVYDTKA